nr:unnamed protein product [Callosobruchus chinensis]
MFQDVRRRPAGYHLRLIPPIFVENKADRSGDGTSRPRNVTQTERSRHVVQVSEGFESGTGIDAGRTVQDPGHAALLAQVQVGVVQECTNGAVPLRPLLLEVGRGVSGRRAVLQSSAVGRQVELRLRPLGGGQTRSLMLRMRGLERHARTRVDVVVEGAV